MKNIIITDLDGTLYDSTGRAHLAQAGLWDEFHEAAPKDLPNMDVLLLLDLAPQVDGQIVAITGRNERYRSATLAWFVHHEVPVDVLLMRPDDNFDSDSTLKVQLLYAWLAENDQALDEIWFVLEDRDQMVEAWRNIGLPCYQVRPGGY